MIQRHLLRQSRAFTSLSQSVTHISRTSPTPFRLLPFQPSRPVAASQCYSTTAEASSSTEGEASAAQETQSETKPKTSEAESREKELEAKNKEIIDLKVRTPPHHQMSNVYTETTNQSPGQIPSLSCRVPQPARANETRYSSREPIRHPAIRQGSRGFGGQPGPRAHHGVSGEGDGRGQ